MKNVLTNADVTRMYRYMRLRDVTTSELCRELNIDYPCFKAMVDGKQPCYNKWQKKISEVLRIDRVELFGGVK